ncbi:MAG: hypothetical protein C0473_02995 [Cyanobacteria bacterium DS3.002]|nr:hypothetical protein [Cyanobacteria bacterium DS3.002]MBA4049844.1 hypothetical protein [Cyanobacteria bacterium DS2.008]MBA4078527.1 hypothetical protein [Cyanobacteria bacterium PR.023]
MIRVLRRVAIFFLPLLLLCSCSVPDFGKIDKEGKAFATELFEQQKPTWDVAKVQSKLTSVNPKDIASIFQIYNEYLGPVETVEPVQTIKAEMAAGINVPDFVGIYKIPLKCQKARAIAQITVNHRDGKWSAVNFIVNSDALKNLNREERAEAQHFVDSIVPKLCKGWKYGNLLETADTQLEKQLKKDKLAAQTLFFTFEKLLGAFKNYSASTLVSETTSEGSHLFSFRGEGEFERADATVDTSVVKQDGHWKVRAFNIRSH